MMPCTVPFWLLIVLMMAFPTLAFLQSIDGNSLQQCEKLVQQLHIILRVCNARFRPQEVVD